MESKLNKNLAFSLLCLILSMILLSYASVPIYSLFCKITGFGGTTKQAVIFNKRTVGNREIKIEFDANVNPNLPWRFVPKQRRITTLTGQTNLVFYESENLSNDDIIGIAIYNVTPNKAGKYFVKVHCFCFEEQLLKAKQKVLMPVSFYIDSEFDSDEQMNDIDTITLSYSFFKVEDATSK